jgi:site-specific DNA-methyltransferase (adenine-specific)
MRFLAPLFGEFAEHGFKYSQDVVWEKQNGTGFHNDRFRRVHEHAVMFYRGAWGSGVGLDVAPLRVARGG